MENWIQELKTLLSKIGIKQKALSVNCGVRFLRQQISHQNFRRGHDHDKGSEFV